MEPFANSSSLSGRTVLVSPGQAAGELAAALGRHAARVIAWPKPDLGEAENYEMFDEAIDNLFGYDWLIFENAGAVIFFLRRLKAMGHEISELDALRVCSVGEEAAARLEQSQVHLDVIPDGLSFQTIVDAIGTYLGGANSIRGLNFLIPRAGNSRIYLQEALEAAGGRVDLVTAYRTCAANDLDFARLDALINGGGIDCIVFDDPSELWEFAQLFGTDDVARMLAGVAVACGPGTTTAQTASRFGLTVDISGRGSDDLVQAIASHFRAR
jgi:uroporphyrinogen III methyltransferase/synthase